MENSNFEEQQRYTRAQKRVKAMSGFYKHLMAYIFVNLFLIALKYFKLEPHENFWRFSTFSTAFYWGIGLFVHGVNVFGSHFFFGKDWEEKKIQEYMHKKRTSKWE